MKIVFVLGTKAQFIKSKYVLANLIDHGFKILIIDTGQHYEITKEELKRSLKDFEYIKISNNTNNISKVSEMLFWFIKIIFKKEKNLNLNAEYCIIHGDTISTLIGLIWAKKNKLKIVHLEAGLRSFNFFKPFPEEIIRVIVSKYSDVLCVDNAKAEQNINKYIKTKKIIKISRNTIYDSVAFLLSNNSIIKNNVLSITIHRTENIYSKKKLFKLVDLITEISSRFDFDEINWYCHDITKTALKRNKLENILQNNNVFLKDLLPHDEFICELFKSRFVITDGGSIAEECSILSISTIIWRDVIENYNYLNSNVILSEYDKSKIFNFMESSQKVIKLEPLSVGPSEEFVKNFIKIVI